MKFLGDLILGWRSYVRAVKFIVAHKLWWYFAIPLVLSIGIYYIGLEASKNIKRDEVPYHEDMHDLMIHLIYLFWLTIVSQLSLKFTKYLVVSVLSPVLAILSERVENQITGNKYPFKIKQLIIDIKRSLRIVVRNIVIELIFFVVWFLLTLIFPFLEFITPFYILIVGFYFYGFGFMDYINERRRMDVSESVRFVKNNKGIAFGIGSVYSLLFFIDFIGVVIAPILAIVAATMAMHEVIDLNKNEHAIQNINQKPQMD